jgi:GGDEF domain-containing protein
MSVDRERKISDYALGDLPPEVYTEISAQVGLPADHPAVLALVESLHNENILSDALSALQDQLREVKGELDETSHDANTGLLLRGPWERRVRREIESIKRAPDSQESYLALLVITDAEDLHFINNRLGFIVGDQAVNSVGEGMKLFAEFMKNVTRTHDRDVTGDDEPRPTDLIGRLGGDEFAGFFPFRESSEFTREDVALIITERLKEGFPKDQDSIPLVSWGYTFVLPGDINKVLEDYISEADPKAHLKRFESVRRGARRIGRKAIGRYTW